MERSYDLIVIGGGVGGCRAAETAARRGRRVLLAEQGEIGGTCLHSGCIPSKYYLEVAGEYERIRKRDRQGIWKGGAELQFEAMARRQRRVVDTLCAGMEQSLEMAGVNMVRGQARLLEERERPGILINGEQYRAETILLATGSNPAVPQIRGIREGLQSGLVHTNKTFFQRDTLPDRLVIVGAGTSGVEMAYAFRIFGAEVVLVEMEGRILHEFDADIAQCVQEILKKRGIRLCLEAAVREVGEDAVVLEVSGVETTLSCDCVYLCTGRQGRRGEESSFPEDIFIDARGFAVTDQNYQITRPHVYAIGDLRGEALLAHGAISQARSLIAHLYDGEAIAPARPLPSVLYLVPECIRVGETEESLAGQEIPYSVEQLSMNESGRYVAANGGTSREGRVKLLFDREGYILGASMISSYASETAVLLEHMIEDRMDCERIAGMMFPHPTEGELIRDCAERHLRRLRTQ